MTSAHAREGWAVHELGAVVRTHHVDNDRRRSIGAWGTGAGGVAALTAVALGGALGSAASRQAFAVAVALAVPGLWLGVWHWGTATWLAGERLVVHERGLVHATARREVIVPWAAVAHVRVRFGQVRSPVARYFGSQLSVRLALRGSRRKVRFNGLVEGYDRLLETVLHHCAPAPGRSLRARWAYAGMAVVSVGACLGLVAYIVSGPELPGAARAAVTIGLGGGVVLAVVGFVLAAKRN